MGLEEDRGSNAIVVDLSGGQCSLKMSSEHLVWEGEGEGGVTTGWQLQSRKDKLEQA